MTMITEEGVDRRISDFRKCFSDSNYMKIRDMSDEILREAVLAEDGQLTDLSLICYAVFKISSKSTIRRSENWEPFKKEMLGMMRRAEEKPNTKEELGALLQDIIGMVSKFYDDYGLYVENVVHKARLKQGLRAYAMGLSLGRSADMVGVSKGELFKYVGATKVGEREGAPITGAMQRLSYLEAALGK